MLKITLSPSKLHLYLDCPRCFWLQEANGRKRPSSAFPSLPSGMDAALKQYFDSWRERRTLPPEVLSEFKGFALAEERLLKKWRNNRVGLRWYDETLDAELMGALDDCLFDGEHYIPLDFKTRGWEPKETTHYFFQNQMDTYTLLLEKNGYPHLATAFLLFYSPKEVRPWGAVDFVVTPVKIKTYPARAEQIFRKAVATIRGPKPVSYSRCEWCSWGAGQPSLTEDSAVVTRSV